MCRWDRVASQDIAILIKQVVDCSPVQNANTLLASRNVQHLRKCMQNKV